MRFALRNKKKIVNAFNEKYYNRMIISLKKHFAENEVIEEIKHDGDKYSFILVDDITHTDGIFEFYVISKLFDVYKLAYKSFIS